MAAPRFPQCLDCYFFNRAPEVCEGCSEGDQFESAELDYDGLDELRELQDSYK